MALLSSSSAALTSQSVMQLFSPELEQEIDAILAHGSPFTRGPNSISPFTINVRRSPPRCVAPPRWLRLHCGTFTNSHEYLREKEQKEEQEKYQEIQEELNENFSNKNSNQKDYMDEIQRVKSKIRKRRKKQVSTNNNTTETSKAIDNISYENANPLLNAKKRSYRHVHAPENLLDCVDSPSGISSLATSRLASRATELNYHNHHYYEPSPSEQSALATNLSDDSKHTLTESSIHIDLTESMTESQLHSNNNNTYKQPVINNVNKSYSHYLHNTHGQINYTKKKQEENRYYINRIIPAPMLVWSEVCVNESTTALGDNTRVITVLMESPSKQPMKAHTRSNELSYQSEDNSDSHIEEWKESKVVQGVLLLTLSTQEFESYTVHDVKRAIHQRISVALPTQQLLFEGVTLCDELPIALLHTDPLVLTLQIITPKTATNNKRDASFATMESEHDNVANIEIKSISKNTANSSLSTQSQLSSLQSSANISEVTDVEMQGIAKAAAQINKNKESYNYCDYSNSKNVNTNSKMENSEKDATDYLKRTLMDALPPISMLSKNTNSNNKWQHEQYKEKEQQQQQKRITSLLTELSLSSSSSTSSNAIMYNNNKSKYHANKLNSNNITATNNLQSYSADVFRNTVKPPCAVYCEGSQKDGGGAGGVDAWSSNSTTSQDEDVNLEDSSSNKVDDDSSKAVTNKHNEQKRKTSGIHVLQSM